MLAVSRRREIASDVSVAENDSQRVSRNPEQDAKPLRMAGLSVHL